MKYFDLVRQPAVITPHWFDDSFKLSRLQPLERYLFPDPIVFKPHTSTRTSESESDAKHKQSEHAMKKLKKMLDDKIQAPNWISDKERSEDRRAVWASVRAANEGGLAKNQIPSSQAEEGVWAGRRILLSDSLELASGRRASVHAQITSHQGEVVDLTNPTASDYDILIITHSEGDEFVEVSACTIYIWCTPDSLLCRQRRQKNSLEPYRGCFMSCLRGD